MENKNLKAGESTWTKPEWNKIVYFQIWTPEIAYATLAISFIFFGLHTFLLRSTLIGLKSLAESFWAQVEQDQVSMEKPFLEVCVYD